eukprot:766349-Hanusia_phi.AAC.8
MKGGQTSIATMLEEALKHAAHRLALASNISYTYITFPLHVIIFDVDDATVLSTPSQDDVVSAARCDGLPVGQEQHLVDESRVSLQRLPHRLHGARVPQSYRPVFARARCQVRIRRAESHAVYSPRVPFQLADLFALRNIPHPHRLVRCSAHQHRTIATTKGKGQHPSLVPLHGLAHLRCRRDVPQPDGLVGAAARQHVLVQGVEGEGRHRHAVTLEVGLHFPFRRPDLDVVVVRARSKQRRRGRPDKRPGPPRLAAQRLALLLSSGRVPQLDRPVVARGDDYVGSPRVEADRVDALLVALHLSIRHHLHRPDFDPDKDVGILGVEGHAQHLPRVPGQHRAHLKPTFGVPEADTSFSGSSHDDEAVGGPGEAGDLSLVLHGSEGDLAGVERSDCEALFSC